MKIFLLLFFLLPGSFAVAENKEAKLNLQSHFRFFSQKLNPEYSLPTPLSEKENLNLELEIPQVNEPAIRKIFNKSFTLNTLSARIEIYFFYQNSQKYLSQQVFIYKDDKLISKCTAYFGLDQQFLVPGACAGAGADGELLYGLALFKGRAP